MISTQYECSVEASRTWGRLLAVYALRRAKGDAQLEGHDWAEWGPLPPRGGHSDLGTEARLLFIASVGVLARLEEERGHPAHLARTRLKGHGIRSVCEDLGIKYCGRRDDECRGCDAHRHIFCAKEWLHWALTDPVADEPELPW